MHDLENLFHYVHLRYSPRFKAVFREKNVKTFCIKCFYETEKCVCLERSKLKAWALRQAYLNRDQHCPRCGMEYCKRH